MKTQQEIMKTWASIPKKLLWEESVGTLTYEYIEPKDDPCSATSKKEIVQQIKKTTSHLRKTNFNEKY